MTDSTPAPSARSDIAGLGCVAAFFGIFLLIGLVVMFFTGRGIVEGIRAAGWPVAEGTLLSAEERLETETSSSSRYGRGSTVTSGSVEVEYTYRVGGREYTGRRVHPAYWRSSFLAAHVGLDSLLEAGQRVQVRYRPGDPERSTLSVGFFSSTLAAFFGGLCFFVFGAAPLAAAWYNGVKGDRKTGKLMVHVLWIGVVGTMALAILFAFRGSQDFASGITILP